jgi:anti-sigma regulatory factor (Ser/Thr protein kinase)
MRRTTYTFASDTVEIGRARRSVEDTLASWGVRVDADLALLVSELMTNAVRHGRGTVHLALEVDDRRVRVEVHDEGAGLPRARTPQLSGSRVGGFGLNLVAAIADDWGVDPVGGTRVWAETRRPPERSGGPPAAT